MMQIEYKGRLYRADASRGIDVSIPLIGNGPQPNTYGVPHARSAPYRDGSFVGDTREGGSCNFETITLTPHCNGTHTEGIGHLTLERIPVRIDPAESLIPACLVTLLPCSPAETNETYSPEFNPEDQLLTRQALIQSLEAVSGSREVPAILIRTLPNGADKCSRDYMQQAPPFFTHEAMQLLTEIGFRHLLTDIPSLDRLFDEGKLSNHRIWWNQPNADSPIDPGSAHRTVTEMIFVPDNLKDGLYLLNLQLAPIVGDATPSRPVLFPLENP